MTRFGQFNSESSSHPKEVIQMEFGDVEVAPKRTQQIIPIEKIPEMDRHISQAVGEHSEDRVQEESYLSTTTTIKVCNVDKSLSDAAVRDFFSAFGPFYRCSRLKSERFDNNSKNGAPVRKDHQSVTYVTYETREIAENAMAKLDRSRFNNLVLHVEWAKPNGSGGGGGGGGGASRNRYTGYGQSLAQDTKEDVIYTSHR